MINAGKIVRTSDNVEAPFLRLRGQPQASGVIVEPFTRPGVDGVGVVKLAKQARLFTLVGFRDFETMADASNAGREITENLKGVACKIIDSSGQEWPDMVCLDVRVREPLPVLLGVGGLTNQPGAVIEIEMDFIYRK